MHVRWERRHSDLYLGFLGNGQELAQVAHVYRANGDDVGWVGWLSLERRELLDHHPTAADAMRAAETAIGRAAA